MPSYTIKVFPEALTDIQNATNWYNEQSYGLDWPSITIRVARYRLIYAAIERTVKLAKKSEHPQELFQSIPQGIAGLPLSQRSSVSGKLSLLRVWNLRL